MRGLGVAMLGLGVIGAAPAAAGLANAGFETQGASGTYCYFGNIDAPTACGAGAWYGAGSFHNDAGIIASGSGGWGGIGAEESAFFGFVQANGVLSQTFTADATGQFTLGWAEAARPRTGGVGGDQTYAVSIDGVTVFLGSSISGQAWQARTSSAFDLTEGQTYTLSFVGQTLTDDTAFIDALNLSASPMPEPTSWATMLGGFALVGSALRLRTQRIVRA